MRPPAHLTVLTLAATPLVVLGGTPSQAEDIDARATRPDLSVSALKAPTAATTGSTVRLVATVRASGAKAAASVVRFYLSPDKQKSGGDDVLATAKTPSLGAGGTTTVSASPTLPHSLGPRYVIACADATRVVAESDEGDNCRTTGLWVRPEKSTYHAGTPDPLSVKPTTAAKSVSKRIDSTGGSLSIAAGGTTYTLVVPKKALVSGVTITMTPLTKVGGLPMSGGLVAGVDLQPSGLQLLEPAALTMKGASVPVARRTGFVYDGSGADFRLYGLETAKTPTIEISHFTGVGVGDASDADRKAQANRVPLRSQAQWEQQLAALKHAIDKAHHDSLTGLDEQAAIDAQAALAGKGAELLGGYLRQVAIPQLKTALAGDTTRLGGPAIVQFIAVVRQLSLLGALDAYDAEYQQGMGLVVKIYEKMLDDAATRCVSEHEPAMAIFMLGVARQLALLGVDADLPTDRMSKCLRFEVDFETEIHISANHSGDSDDFTDAGPTTYHLQALDVPVQFDVDKALNLQPDPVTGEGPEGYLTYDYSADHGFTLYDDNGDPYTCHEQVTSESTIDGIFHVRGLDLDLNVYRDDPTYGDTSRITMKIDPGRIGDQTAPRDVTKHTSSCWTNASITNWYWGMAFYLFHFPEANGADASSYKITGFKPGVSGGATLGTKIYDLSKTQPGGPTYTELTSIVLRHTPAA